MIRIIPAPPLFSLEKEPEGLHISVPAKITPMIVLNYVIMLIIFGSGLLTTIIQLSSSHYGPDPGTIIFFIAWLGIFAVILWTNSWRYLSKEDIHIDNKTLRIRYALFYFSRTFLFDVRYISNFRAASPSIVQKFRRGLIRRGSIAFDYGRETYQFGQRLNALEAKHIVKEITDRFQFTKEGLLLPEKWTELFGQARKTKLEIMLQSHNKGESDVA
jgi:hypothetical protein